MSRIQLVLLVSYLVLVVAPPVKAENMLLITGEDAILYARTAVYVDVRKLDKDNCIADTAPLKKSAESTLAGLNFGVLEEKIIPGGSILNFAVKAYEHVEGICVVQFSTLLNFQTIALVPHADEERDGGVDTLVDYYYPVSSIALVGSREEMNGILPAVGKNHSEQLNRIIKEAVQVMAEKHPAILDAAIKAANGG